MSDLNMEEYLSVSASKIVRLYLWQVLQQRMPSTWKPGEGILTIPIIPAQDQPETQVATGPYIVYDYSNGPTGDLYQMENETMTLRIFSENADVLNSTVKLCRRLFDRRENTAADLNRWLFSDTGLGAYATPGDPVYNKWMDEARNLKFLTFAVSGTQGAAPAETQEGRLDTLVFIDITYVESYWPEEFA